MKRRFLTLLTVLAVMVPVSLIQATPALATVTTYGCYPGPNTWEVVARWDNGTVAEHRGCLQRDSVSHKVRSRLEARVRKGTTPISGADWDLDDENGTQVGLVNGVYMYNSFVGVVENDNYADDYDESYIAKYSNWGCRFVTGADNYLAYASNWAVTPPGLPKSGYKLTQSVVVRDDYYTCP